MKRWPSFPWGSPLGTKSLSSSLFFTPYETFECETFVRQQLGDSRGNDGRFGAFKFVYSITHNCFTYTADVLSFTRLARSLARSRIRVSRIDDARLSLRTFLLRSSSSCLEFFPFTAVVSISARDFKVFYSVSYRIVGFIYKQLYNLSLARSRRSPPTRLLC